MNFLIKYDSSKSIRLIKITFRLLETMYFFVDFALKITEIVDLSTINIKSSFISFERLSTKVKNFLTFF